MSLRVERAHRTAWQHRAQMLYGRAGCSGGSSWPCSAFVFHPLPLDRHHKPPPPAVVAAGRRQAAGKSFRFECRSRAGGGAGAWHANPDKQAQGCSLDSAPALAQPDALPGAEVEAAIRDRYRCAAAKHRRLAVRLRQREQSSGVWLN